MGLGNPGPQHHSDRHNAGFWFLDLLAEYYQLAFRAESRFKGEVARLQAGGREAWLLKPATYMNRSGEAVRALAAFYKIPLEKVLVVHDELDIEPGDIRLKRAGGHGGHNGLRDIIQKCGGNSFTRLRIGIGHPGSAAQVTGYVLGRPTASQEADILAACRRGQDVMSQMLAGDIELAMNQLHSKQ